MGNSSHASLHGISTVDLMFTFGKIIHLKNVEHVSKIDNNLAYGPFLCKDGFMLVLSQIK